MVETYRFSARLQRHRPDLPVYLVVPADFAVACGCSATFVVDAELDGIALGRRSVKPWSTRPGDDRWFLELTKAHCARLDRREGDTVQVALAPARELPEDLEEALQKSDLVQAWSRLSAAQRRAMAEPVFEAKTAATRARRVQRAIDALLGPR